MAAGSALWRRIADRWPLAAAAVLCLYALLLLGNAFHARAQLRDEADSHILADGRRRAAAVADALAQRRNGAQILAESQEVANYFINRALGMSPRYGLNANLALIEDRFRRRLETLGPRGERLFDRILFSDETGTVLVDMQAAAGPLPPLPPPAEGGSIVLLPDRGWIVAAAPVVAAQGAGGTVVTVGDLAQVSRDLIASDAEAGEQEILVTATGEELPAANGARRLSAERLDILRGLRENTLTPVHDPEGRRLLAVRTPVPGAELSLVTLESEESAYGQITSPFFLYLASAFPFILLYAAFMVDRNRRVKEALAQSEQRFRTIFENIRDAILLVEMPGGTVVEANPRAGALFGQERADLAGTDTAALAAGEAPYDAAHWAERLSRAADGGLEFFPWQARHGDGSLFWVEITLLRATIDGRDRLLLVAHDITRRKTQEQELLAALDYQRQLNQKLEEAHNQLLQSEKLASIGQLAAGVAHEINNPIGYVYSNLNSLKTYVRQFLDLLDAYGAAETGEGEKGLARARSLRAAMDLNFLREDVAALLSESSQGIERVVKIIKDLKDFSHVDRDEHWAMEDLHKGLESTLNVVWNEIKYKCEVRREYGDLPPVECLIFQLNQVFMNLLVNAAHAIREKGVITLRTGAEGDQVWVEVQDNGVGIPPANLTRIFDPFFTTKPVGKGTGLGLSVSYSIVKKHHGSLTVESREGEGATFRITLPVRQPPAPPDDEAKND